jgi:hypothetical protein
MTTVFRQSVTLRYHRLETARAKKRLQREKLAMYSKALKAINKAITYRARRGHRNLKARVNGENKLFSEYINGALNVLTDSGYEVSGKGEGSSKVRATHFFGYPETTHPNDSHFPNSWTFLVEW